MDYGIAPPGFRMPADIRLGPVRLQVSDLTRSRAWYERVLGLRLLGPGDRAARLGTPSGEPLVELVERAGAAPVRPRSRLGLFHFAILLPDRASLGRLVTHLARQSVPTGSADHRVSEALYLQDPDGLGIEVYADRPRSAWRHADRQLVMATDPLDRASLVSAAEGSAWTGMPDGAVMGHVHLHVGDLERASRFYHEGLGLDRVVWSYPGALFLSAGGYHHHLGLNTWARGATPPGAAEARLLEWTVVLPTPDLVRGTVDSLSGAGFEAPLDRDGAGAAAFDPWGTAVRLRSA